MKKLCSNCLDCTITNCKTCSIGQKKIEEFEYIKLLNKLKKNKAVRPVKKVAQPM